MSRVPYWLAIWRVNRIYPLLLFGLLLVNILLYVVLSATVFPSEDALQRDFLAVESQLRNRHSPRASSAESLRQAEAEFAQFQRSIPPREDFSALIGDLYALASDSELLLTQISYQPKELAAEGLLAYSLSFSVAGTYPQLKRFIHGLEQSRRLIMIDDLSLNGAPASDDGEGVTLNLHLTTYFRGAST